MPFMIGKGPIRRTLKYLESGVLHLREGIKVLSINYNVRNPRHQGAKDLAFWELPRIQHLNPNVQVVTLVNITPLPFVKCYFENGRSMIVDVDNKSQQEIMDHLVKVMGKSSEEATQTQQIRLDNPANFGVGCNRPCLCMVSTQVPCPGAVQLPKMLRGKYKYSKGS